MTPRVSRLRTGLLASFVAAGGIVQAAGSPSAYGLRDAIDRVAHRSELCARDPGHSDCMPERVEAMCRELSPAVGTPVPEFDDGLDDVAYRLVRLVAGAMVDSACVGSGDGSADRPGVDVVFRKALLERQRAVEGVARRFHGELLRHSAPLRVATSEALGMAEFVVPFAESPEGARYVGIEGEAIDAEEIARGTCAELPRVAGEVLERHAAFHERFAGIPAARIAVAAAGARAFNALAYAWEVLAAIDLDECSTNVPVAESWWIVPHRVEPGHRLPVPEFPTIRFPSAARSEDAELSKVVTELQGWLAGNPPRPDVVRECDLLEVRLRDKFAPSFDRVRVAARAREYLFPSERARMLATMEEVYLMTAVLAEACDADVDSAGAMGDYVRSFVELVRLLDPALAPQVSRYLGRRYGVDMDREL